MKNEQLISLAKEAMKQAYCPYSEFSVGAALLCGNGKIYTGCNIENASYSLCICAERTAFSKAVSDGERKFKKIAVVGGKNGKSEGFCYPCGACRQVMAEFCKEDFELFFENENGETEVFTLGQMLPKSFRLGEKEI